MERLAEQGDLAGIRQGDPDHHAQGAGLAGAVGPEQAVDGARGDLEGEVVDGHEVVVGFSDFAQFDSVHVPTR